MKIENLRTANSWLKVLLVWFNGTHVGLMLVSQSPLTVIWFSGVKASAWGELTALMEGIAYLNSISARYFLRKSTWNLSFLLLTFLQTLTATDSSWLVFWSLKLSNCSRIKFLFPRWFQATFSVSKLLDRLTWITGRQKGCQNFSNNIILIYFRTQNSKLLIT